MSCELTMEPERELTEPEAIRRAQHGDATAFEYLYNAHSKRVFNLCLRMLKNRTDAEDLTQQAFLQLFRKIATFRGESCFSTWLHRVTVNVVLMHLRRKQPPEIIVYGSDQGGTGGDNPREPGPADTSMLGAIDRLHLKRAIRQLPSGYKRLFFVARRLWIQAPRDYPAAGMLNVLLQVAVASGSQTPSPPVARRTSSSGEQCRLRIRPRGEHHQNWTETTPGRHAGISSVQ